MLKCGVFVAVVDLMRIVRKPVFGVSDQVTHKPGRTAIRVARGLGGIVVVVEQKQRH